MAAADCAGRCVVWRRPGLEDTTRTGKYTGKQGYRKEKEKKKTEKILVRK